MRALLTGFEGWAGRVNPSGKIAKYLDKSKLGELTVSGRELPEDFTRLPSIIKDLVTEIRPDVIIGTGWDYVSSIKVEKIALNFQNSMFGEKIVPDNYNHSPIDRPVISRGNLALKASLPAEKIASAIAQKRVPVFVSYQAGTHCCNTVMYSAIYYSHRIGKPQSLAGFMHIPPIKEMRIKECGSLSLEQEVTAIQSALETCRDSFHANSRSKDLQEKQRIIKKTGL